MSKLLQQQQPNWWLTNCSVRKHVTFLTPWHRGIQLSLNKTVNKKPGWLLIKITVLKGWWQPRQKMSTSDLDQRDGWVCTFGWKYTAAFSAEYCWKCWCLSVCTEVNILWFVAMRGWTEPDEEASCTGGEDRCQSATSPVSHLVLGSCHHSARKDSS